jgi:hypothetical protein
VTTTASATPVSERAITVVWLALSAITVASWWLAHGDGGAVASVPITLAVVALAAVKGRLIIRYFMEVRGAPRWLRWATDAWLVGLWVAVLTIYLLTP